MNNHKIHCKYPEMTFPFAGTVQPKWTIQVKIHWLVNSSCHIICSQSIDTFCTQVSSSCHIWLTVTLSVTNLPKRKTNQTQTVSDMRWNWLRGWWKDTAMFWYWNSRKAKLVVWSGNLYSEYILILCSSAFTCTSYINSTENKHASSPYHVPISSSVYSTLGIGSPLRINIYSTQSSNQVFVFCFFFTWMSVQF